jgi:hypothetical protein
MVLRGAGGGLSTRGAAGPWGSRTRKRVSEVSGVHAPRGRPAARVAGAAAGEARRGCAAPGGRASARGGVAPAASGCAGSKQSLIGFWRAWPWSAVRYRPKDSQRPCVRPAPTRIPRTSHECCVQHTAYPESTLAPRAASQCELQHAASVLQTVTASGTRHRVRRERLPAAQESLGGVLLALLPPAKVVQHEFKLVSTRLRRRGSSRRPTRTAPSPGVCV